MLRKGLFTLISILVITVIALAGCQGTTTTQETKTLKIGALISMTGFASASETLIWDGILLYQDWINDKGGIEIKGQKYKLEFVAQDSQSSADGALAATNKLVLDEGVKFIIGPVMPFMVTSSGTVTEPSKVLRVCLYNAGTPDEYGPNTPYTFIANDCTLDFITPNMDYMSGTYPSVKNITVLTPDDGAPAFIEPVFKSKAEEYGYKVNDFVLWSLDTQDFTPIVSKGLASNPDSIFLINGWPIHMGAMLKAARQAGFTGPVFACHEDPYDILEVAGAESSTNFYTHNLTIESSEMTPLIKEIISLAKVKYGKMSATYVWGFSPAYCLTQAIEKAQSIDPTDVKNAWEKMSSIETAYGTGRMGGMDTYGIAHNVSAPMPLTALDNGQVKWVKWQDVPLP